MDLRNCPNPDCDAEIANTETTCPKCSVNIAELDEQIGTVDRAHRALVKQRKAVAAKKRAEVPNPEPVPEKKSIFRNLVPRKEQ